MIEGLRPYVSDIVDIVDIVEVGEVVAERGTTGCMQFAPLGSLAAEEMLGKAAHEAAAKALRRPLIRALG
jgi:hypothetical protein